MNRASENYFPPGAARPETKRDPSNPLRGKTVRFTFHDGPTKGTSYDHTFRDDETVTWRDGATPRRNAPGKADTSKQDDAEKEPSTKYGLFQVADDVFVVSYLSNSGYTLTVALNFETDELFGFASNHEHWYPVRGIFEVVEG